MAQPWSIVEMAAFVRLWGDGATDDGISEALSKIERPRSVEAVKRYRLKRGYSRVRIAPGPVVHAPPPCECTEEDAANGDAAFVAAMAAAGFAIGSTPFAGSPALEIPQRLVPVRTSRPIHSLGTGWQM